VITLGLTIYPVLVSPWKGNRRRSGLPFANTGKDPNAEYLSEGITESITNNLSQLAGCGSRREHGVRLQGQAGQSAAGRGRI